MKRISNWLIGLLVVAALGYAGWTLYNKVVAPQSSQTASTSTLQVVKLATGSLETSVSAIGSVRTNQSALVTWQASGKVGAIAVKEGNVVKAGDILASLDPVSLSTEVLAADADLSTAQSALAALTSSKTALYQAEKDVIDAQTALDKAQSHRNLMNSDTRGTEDQIAQAQQQYNRAEDNVNRLRQIYERLPGDPATELHNKAPALLALEKSKTARDTALAALNWYAAKWSASDIAGADQSLAVAKAALADARAALAKLQAGPDSAELAAAKLRITSDQATIQTQTVTAPISGTVTLVNSQVGDLVTNKTVSFRIDDTSAYFVDLSVAEADLPGVKLGQPVTFTFDAIEGKTYNGVVSAIGQVGTSVNSVVSFTVTVRITDADSSIKPGMTAAASIVTASVENALVVPSRAIQSVGNQKVVYRVSGASTLTPVVVTVGLASDTGVQITSDALKVGDLIAANPSAGVITGLASTTTH